MHPTCRSSAALETTDQPPKRRSSSSSADVIAFGLAFPSEHARRQLALVGVHREDGLLDRAARDEAVDRDRLRLADAMRAIGRLILDRGVPPRVEVDDVVGRVRLRPVPPALSETQKTSCSPAWNARRIARRSVVGVSPVEIATESPAPSSRPGLRGWVNWLNTSARWPSSRSSSSELDDARDLRRRDRRRRIEELRSRRRAGAAA